MRSILPIGLSLIVSGNTHLSTKSIPPNLKLTYGLRFDLPLYFDDLLGNAAIKEQSFNGTNVDVSEWPKSKLLISPRLGFNWDIKGDRSIVLTGGTGLFTGLLPFVWFTNQPTNAGQMQNMVEFETSELPANFAFNPNYKETLTQNPDMFPSTPGNEVPGAIALWIRILKCLKFGVVM